MSTYLPRIQLSAYPPTIRLPVCHSVELSTSLLSICPSVLLFVSYSVDPFIYELSKCIPHYVSVTTSVYPPVYLFSIYFPSRTPYPPLHYVNLYFSTSLPLRQSLFFCFSPVCFLTHPSLHCHLLTFPVSICLQTWLPVFLSLQSSLFFYPLSTTSTSVCLPSTSLFLSPRVIISNVITVLKCYGYHSYCFYYNNNN